MRYINYLDKLEGGKGDWKPSFDISELEIKSAGDKRDKLGERDAEED